jgi:YggT family protein
MDGALVLLVRFVQQALILLIVVYALLSFVMSPYHPVRIALAKVVEPLLRPIQRLIPAVGGVDFSPMVLIFLVYFLGTLLIHFLS